MKTCKKNMAIVLSFMLAAASIAMPSTESKAAKMKLNKSSVTVAVGKKVSLKVKGTTKKVRWTTSKKAIASVSKRCCNREESRKGNHYSKGWCKEIPLQSDSKEVIEGKKRIDNEAGIKVLIYCEEI